MSLIILGRSTLGCIQVGSYFLKKQFVRKRTSCLFPSASLFDPLFIYWIIPVSKSNSKRAKKKKSEGSAKTNVRSGHNSFTIYSIFRKKIFIWGTEGPMPKNQNLLIYFPRFCPFFYHKVVWILADLLDCPYAIQTHIFLRCNFSWDPKEVFCRKSELSMSPPSL